MNKRSIRELTPAQLAASEPHFWATEPMGSHSICREVREWADGLFLYLAGNGSRR